MHIKLVFHWLWVRRCRSGVIYAVDPAAADCLIDRRHKCTDASIQIPSVAVRVVVASPFLNEVTIGLRRVEVRLPKCCRGKGKLVTVYHLGDQPRAFKHLVNTLNASATLRRVCFHNVTFPAGIHDRHNLTTGRVSSRVVANDAVEHLRRDLTTHDTTDNVCRFQCTHSGSSLRVNAHADTGAPTSSGFKLHNPQLLLDDIRLDNTTLARKRTELAKKNVAFERYLYRRVNVREVAAPRTCCCRRTSRSDPVRRWIHYFDKLCTCPAFFHTGQSRFNRVAGNCARDENDAPVWGVGDAFSPVRHCPHRQLQHEAGSNLVSHSYSDLPRPAWR